MKFKKIAILTSKPNWFIPHAKKLLKCLNKKNYDATLFFDHKEISSEYQIVLIGCYHKIISKQYLNLHKHNLVVHGSNLPNGKGWAPIFWQIIEDKNTIPIVLFEAAEKVDAGKIYLKDFIEFNGNELHDSIRKAQAKKTIELFLKFLKEYEKIQPKKQKGKSTFYSKRLPKDSELNINKTINKQFNLLRTVNNKEFPAFFYKNGEKYIIKIYKEKSSVKTRK